MGIGAEITGEDRRRLAASCLVRPPSGYTALGQNEGGVYGISLRCDEQYLKQLGEVVFTRRIGCSGSEPAQEQRRGQRIRPARSAQGTTTKRGTALVRQ